MKWVRAKIPLNVTKNNLDPFEYFFNRQKDQENNKIVETPITDEVFRMLMISIIS